MSGTDVYYGPYELKNNETTKATIANTANTGSLTIDKTDAKTELCARGRDLHGERGCVGLER